MSKLTAGKRVTLLSDSYKLSSMLPSSVDPLVSLMMVEKVPDSTYDMIGGLDEHQSFWFRVGAKVHWRGFTNGARAVRHGTRARS
jgi:hypothetical protein